MEHHNVTIEQAARVIAAQGADAFCRLADALPAVNAKHGEEDLGRVEAGLNLLGSHMDAVLAGDEVLEFRQAVKDLFDRHGRFIPFMGMESRFRDPASKYQVSRPEISCAEILEWQRRFLPKELAETLVGASEFEDSVQAAKAKLDGDERTKNATKGAWFPAALPKMQGEYGEILDILVAAAKKAYEAAFPGRTFYNYRHGMLAGQITIVSGTRHDRLVEAVREKSQAGIFLLPFGGFSVNACREVFAKPEYAQRIPDWLMLSGGWDTAIVYSAYPKVFCRDVETPIVRCAALNQRSGYSLYFNAHDAHADFDYAVDLAGADVYYSAGVLCLG